MLAKGKARSGVQSVLLGCALDLSRQSLTPSNHLSEILLQPGRSSLGVEFSGSRRCRMIMGG